MQPPLIDHAAATPLADPGTRRETSRLTGEQRRQHFIDTALHLFSTRGFRGTTTKAIAAAAGVSEALLFRHFATKQDLYAAILRSKAEQSGFQARLQALRSGTRKIPTTMPWWRHWSRRRSKATSAILISSV